MKQNLKNVVLAAGLACTALTGQAQNVKPKTTQTVSNSLMNRVRYLLTLLISVISRVQTTYLPSSWLLLSKELR